MDSLYHGYPTGYLITWKNPDVKIKGGGVAEGKTVLIDGQQRVTALTAALAGKPVLNDDYESKRVKIAFNPLYDGGDTPFAVLTPVIDKDSRWISDVAEFFAPDFDSWTFVNGYIEANPGCDPKVVNARITDLKAIATRQLGCIVVAAECSIDEVTDIFIRINSKGAVLSQADFAMSKIAADEAHGGKMLRKAIDYYCHLAVKPEFWATISQQDPEFMASEYSAKAEWLKDDKDDIYDPDYNDVLRVSFMHMFGRGKLADLVSLLSGRYSGSSESVMDRDMRRIADQGFIPFYEEIAASRFADTFWDVTLPQDLATISTRSSAWMVFVASQVRAADNTLFTNGFKVADVIANVGDIHHIFPRAYLKKSTDAPQRLYNQVANYAYLEKRINIAIGEKRPGEYFSQARDAIRSGASYFGDIADEGTLLSNLKANCIPEGIFEMSANDYEDFLAQRRVLMARKIRNYYESL